MYRLLLAALALTTGCAHARLIAPEPTAPPDPGVQRGRPSWRVTSAGGVPALSGPVSLVRTVIGRVQVVETNRSFKNLACAFGILIPPLLLLAISPVREDQRVEGSLVRYETDAET